MLPLAARVTVAETGHLVVGLEPILQTVVVMVGTGRVAGNIGPRAVGVALLLDGLEDEAVDVVVELRVGRRLDAALREPDAAEAPWDTRMLLISVQCWHGRMMSAISVPG